MAGVTPALHTPLISATWAGKGAIAGAAFRRVVLFNQIELMKERKLT